MNLTRRREVGRIEVAGRGTNVRRMKLAGRMLMALVFVVCASGVSAVEAQDLSAHFRNVNGCIVVYDLQKDAYVRHNEARCRQRFSPYSTFKIPNSLIGLETGVIKDADFVIPWNRTKYPPDDWVSEPFINWKRDHNLRTAMQHSVVWYYKELALRVGAARMKKHLAQLEYGNADASGGLDKFWLNSSLRISPEEQIEFLKKFYRDELPFSKRSMRIVKEIIVREETPAYRLSGKTGGGPAGNGRSLGWFVGYVETGGKVYFFATNLEGANYMAIRDERINLTKRILADLGYLPKT
ncbi:MAG TPA: class D beta-lactamase [Pyrinomonadaceae bacterium]